MKKFVHGVPGDRVIKEGDIVSLDTVTELDGYYGDSARTFAIGIIDDESRKLLEVTEKQEKLEFKLLLLEID